MTAPINANIKKKLSEIFSIAAIILLAIDIADTFVAQGGYGFLRLTDQQRGAVNWDTFDDIVLHIIWNRI